MTKLTHNLLDEITSRLVESIHPKLIYLFGSHATGQADQDSDIDLLAVVPDTDKSTREIVIEGRNSLWDFRIPLDLIVCTESQFNRYRQVKNTIMNEALYQGTIVYGS
jgi:predicted nucleotidyltransferase